LNLLGTAAGRSSDAVVQSGPYSGYRASICL
jgi:hypothetical protein